MCGEYALLIDLPTDEINMKTNRTNIWELKVPLLENVNYNAFKLIT